jgi:peptidoglycan/LPS O-acetylase OafA/YrhL
MQTFQDVMSGSGPSKGTRTTGFDYIRIILAIAVVTGHSIDVSYGLRFANEVENTFLLRPFTALILPMFFALSGFLVAGSLERSRSLLSFMGLRAIRLVPALAFETVLVAVILGPLLTSLSFQTYFSDPLFYRYFMNIVGHIQYALPGMFAENPWTGTVNGQLWTLPFELICYISLFALALFRTHQYRYVFLGIVVTLNLLAGFNYTFSGPWNPSPVLQGSALVLSFLYGVAVYLFRDKLHHSKAAGIISGLLCYLLLVHPATDYFVPASAAFFTAYLGLFRPKLNTFVNSGDYSYGVFLYGFPIQQTVAQLLGPIGHQWYWNLPIALPLTIAIAMVSWHAIEKPALNLRKYLFAVENTWIALKERIRPVAPPQPIT